ncbi:hypothetical protein Mapa_008212 [Marchantia paleacea]|nr:hypothetical protein Mapa_008212 [Marchantia paleacea]
MKRAYENVREEGVLTWASTPFQRSSKTPFHEAPSRWGRQQRSSQLLGKNCSKVEICHAASIWITNVLRNKRLQLSQRSEVESTTCSCCTPKPRKGRLSPTRVEMRPQGWLSSYAMGYRKQGGLINLCLVTHGRPVNGQP